MDISTEESFIQNREEFERMFRIAIRDAMLIMGDDIMGVPWFNPGWKRYVAAVRPDHVFTEV